ncbi:alpha/beta fold hydrolase [Streptomyces yaanensis]|uniref:Alpha/beta fold hydrolase n=1 Tax=Streptomyces yaanensis TaxID=1142239 RepID=A0ABV7SFX2_9ACTN|nr:alpha/beta hydrolase [Streptomyces sp. CGMCC 4.7035]WNB99345.1 alpha/beta hydrolase [Streptomyces sp. CGMCC 4.7035]
MDYLAELKEFALLHGRGQGMAPRRIAAVLEQITNDTEGDPDSWAATWTRAGRAAAARGRHLDACAHFALARFPHHGDPVRQSAGRLLVSAFDTWRRRKGGIERLELPLAGGTLACYATGLDAPRPRPLIVVMGGIVSVKEQWAPILPLLGRLGFAAVAAEFPGVGENTLRYAPDSWQLFPDLLDRLAGRAKVSDTSMLTLSFSGHLALRAAIDDRRIRRILTVGAPVGAFFTDADWRPRVPGITVDTLCRLTGAVDETALWKALADHALDEEQLGRVRIPVRYVASARDEIIPADEQRLLGALPDLRVKTYDDVHGSPGHLGAMRRWLFAQLLLTRTRPSLTTKRTPLHTH